jgi:hypothetical protein
MSGKTKSAKNVGAANSDQAVGYAKPPKASRFKPGKSGNPLGRPLGSPNKLPRFGEEQVKSIIRGEFYREVEVVEGKRKFTSSAIAAIAHKLVGKGLSGDSRVAQMVLELALRFEYEERKEYERFVRYSAIYIELWNEEIEFAKSVGRQVPIPNPHPNQFVMDETGLLTIRNAMTDKGSESANSDDDIPIYTRAVARWFLAVITLPPGKDIRHYIRD